jgi:hypothetical protein
MSAPVGEVVPGPLLGCVIKVGLGRAIVGVVNFLLDALISFGSFALAAEIFSFATCLVAAVPKFS